jgi:hypothetical protein
MRADVVIEVLTNEIVRLREELAGKSGMLSALDRRIADMKTPAEEVKVKRGPGRPKKTATKRGPGRPRISWAGQT